LGDTLVLAAKRLSGDGVIEFLFIERLPQERWKCLVKPGRKMRIGATTKIDNVNLRVEEILPEGERVVSL
jgi:S-adenosylmethionine:tRNA ribosyltransferase-isomerase